MMLNVVGLNLVVGVWVAVVVIVVVIVGMAA
jgi:hypothetical protein